MLEMERSLTKTSLVSEVVLLLHQYFPRIIEIKLAKTAETLVSSLTHFYIYIRIYYAAFSMARRKMWKSQQISVTKDDKMSK